MGIKQDVHNYVDEFGDYRRELIRLMLWIGPYVTKGITDGGVMQLVKCTMQLEKSNGSPFLGEVNNRWLKPYTGGEAT